MRPERGPLEEESGWWGCEKVRMKVRINLQIDNGRCEPGAGSLAAWKAVQSGLGKRKILPTIAPTTRSQSIPLPSSNNNDAFPQGHQEGTLPIFGGVVASAPRTAACGKVLE